MNDLEFILGLFALFFVSAIFCAFLIVIMVKIIEYFLHF